MNLLSDTTRRDRFGTAGNDRAKIVTVARGKVKMLGPENKRLSIWGLTQVSTQGELKGTDQPAAASPEKNPEVRCKWLRIPEP